MDLLSWGIEKISEGVKQITAQIKESEEFAFGKEDFEKVISDVFKQINKVCDKIMDEELTESKAKEHINTIIQCAVLKLATRYLLLETAYGYYKNDDGRVALEGFINGSKIFAEERQPPTIAEGDSSVPEDRIHLLDRNKLHYDLYVHFSNWTSEYQHRKHNQNQIGRQKTLITDYLSSLYARSDFGCERMHTRKHSLAIHRLSKYYTFNVSRNKYLADTWLFNIRLSNRFDRRNHKTALPHKITTSHNIYGIEQLLDKYISHAFQQRLNLDRSSSREVEMNQLLFDRRNDIILQSIMRLVVSNDRISYKDYYSSEYFQRLGDLSISMLLVHKELSKDITSRKSSQLDTTFSSKRRLMRKRIMDSSDILSVDKMINLASNNNISDTSVINCKLNDFLPLS